MSKNLRMRRGGELCGMRLQQLPRARDVTLGRAQVADREAQRKPPVQNGVREKHVASGVDRAQQLFVERVELVVAHRLLRRARPEAHDAERYRSEPLEI